MIPGLKTSDGRLYVASGVPAAADPRMGGFALKPTGQVYADAGFSPASLFASGEQGGWYDPSDLTTLFQDSAGTTPVTADGQPVGLILDKSKGGQFVPVTGGTWNKVSGDGVVTVVGNQITITGATTSTRVDYTIHGPQNSLFRINVTYTGSPVSPDMFIDGVPVSFGADKTVGMQNGAHLVRIASGSATFTINSFDVYVGNHASQDTAAARPVYKTDGTYHWLQFDGVDDGLSTAAINFTATDKMSVFAGVQKTSGAGFQTLVELGSGAVENGFSIFAPNSNNNNFDFRLAANPRETAPVYPPPTTKVLSVLYDIAGTTASDEVSANINASNVALTGSTLASGMFINSALNIGRRSGGTLPFNGNIYSLIVRGALSSAQEIDDTEAWVNGKTGAY